MAQPTDRSPPGRSLTERVARRVLPTVNQAAQHVPGTRRQLADLQERVAELEASVEENRRLSRRVAELTDLVAEALLPADRRDEAGLRAALERFAKDA